MKAPVTTISTAFQDVKRHGYAERRQDKLYLDYALFDPEWQWGRRAFIGLQTINAER